MTRAETQCILRDYALKPIGSSSVLNQVVDRTTSALLLMEVLGGFVVEADDAWALLAGPEAPLPPRNARGGWGEAIDAVARWVGDAGTHPRTLFSVTPERPDGSIRPPPEAHFVHLLALDGLSAHARLRLRAALPQLRLEPATHEALAARRVAGLPPFCSRPTLWAPATLG